MPRVFVVPALLLALFLERSASAHPCAGPADCTLGYTCEEAACRQTSLCADDSDCGAGFRCEFRGGICKPAWQLPCQTDVNCGIGFQCLPAIQECDCSGQGYSRPDAAITPLSCDVQSVAVCQDPTNCPRPQCDGGGNACVCTTDFFCEATMAALHACDVDGDCLSGWTCGGCSAVADGGIDSGCALTCQRPNGDYDVTPPPFADDTSSPDLDAATPGEDGGDAASSSGGGSLGPVKHSTCDLAGPGPTQRGSSPLPWIGLGAVVLIAVRRRSLRGTGRLPSSSA
jgi:hypothetical protein